MLIDGEVGLTAIPAWPTLTLPSKGLKTRGLGMGQAGAADDRPPPLQGALAVAASAPIPRQARDASKRGAEVES